MPRVSNDGGKGPRIPGANTTPSLDAYEAGYAAINWNSRGVQSVHGDAVQDGPTHGPGEVQAPDTPTPGA